MLKLFGICILLFTSMLISRELADARRRRLALCEELLRFLSFLRLQIGCFLRPISEIACEFRSSTLSACGFLKDGGVEDLSVAFSSSDAPRIAGKECTRIVESLFTSLGVGYLDNEIGIIDSHRAELTELVEVERTEAARQIRLIRTLTASAAVGLIILII